MALCGRSKSRSRRKLLTEPRPVRARFFRGFLDHCVVGSEGTAPLRDAALLNGVARRITPPALRPSLHVPLHRLPRRFRQDPHPCSPSRVRSIGSQSHSRERRSDSYWWIGTIAATALPLRSMTTCSDSAETRSTRRTSDSPSSFKVTHLAKVCSARAITRHWASMDQCSIQSLHYLEVQLG
jgi:hypothetical protein